MNFSEDPTNPFLEALGGQDDSALLEARYPTPVATDLAETIVRKSNGEKIAITVPKECSPEFFRKVVTAAFTVYSVTKKYPDMAAISAYYPGTPDLKKLAAVMSTSEYDDAMSIRGIEKTHVASGISPEQSYCLEILTDPSRKNQSMESKLRAAGVSYTKYRSWLKNPLFLRTFSSLTEAMLDEHQGDVNVALVNRAISGDMRAIEYYNKLTGRFDPDTKQVLNLQAIINGLLEIITKNIRDPEILDAVVIDIDEMISKQSGKALSAVPLEQPVEVVETDSVFDFER